MDAKALLLTTAFRQSINEPNIEAGFERFQTLAGGSADYATFCAAAAACLREGLIREPIRLPEGALQCHWHLELTPDGVAAARRFLNRSTPPPNPLTQGEGEHPDPDLAPATDHPDGCGTWPGHGDARLHNR
jgi:hypothetical protein